METASGRPHVNQSRELLSSHCCMYMAKCVVWHGKVSRGMERWATRTARPLMSSQFVRMGGRSLALHMGPALLAVDVGWRRYMLSCITMILTTEGLGHPPRLSGMAARHLP